MKRLIGIGKRIRDRFNEFDWDDFWDYLWDDVCPIMLLLVVVSLFILAGILGSSGMFDDGKSKPKDDYVKVYSVRGEPHEYLMIGNQITHLPNCKYCKGETK